MATTFRFERNAMMSACHLGSTTDPESTAFVACSIPGGRPFFQLDPSSQHATSIVGAPAIETHAEFVAFVRERFANED